MAPIGFTAVTNQTREYQLGDQVIFDSLISNYGDHFQQPLNLFICPVSGMYVFQLSLTSLVNTTMMANMMKEQVAMGTVISENTAAFQGSITVVTHCFKGERVWVETLDDDCVLVGDSVDHVSSFTGFLEYPFEE